MRKTKVFIFIFVFLASLFLFRKTSFACEILSTSPPRGYIGETFTVKANLEVGKEYAALLVNDRGGSILRFKIIGSPNNKIKIDKASDNPVEIKVSETTYGDAKTTYRGYIKLHSGSWNPLEGDSCQSAQAITIEPLKTKIEFKPQYCEDTTNILSVLGTCIPIGPTSFTIWFLRLATGVGGGIAFLLMLFGVFQIITSAGDPERLKAGKETITSASIGLLMIIFSVFLLQLIGVQILQIPGFQADNPWKE